MSDGDEHVRQRVLVEDLVAALGDSSSRRYFVMVAARLPEQDVRFALSDTIEARRSGALRKTAGAYFTAVVKRAAEARGISLARRARGAA